MKKPSSSTLTFLFFAAVIVISFRWNPLDYFWEAGPSSYYQGRVAFEYGNAFDRSKIRQTASSGKITMHDYSAVIFPAYLKTLPAGESNPFPDSEAKKTNEQLRSEFIAIVNKN